VIGVALLGTLVASRGTFIVGLRTAMVIAGGVFVLGAILTALFVDRAHPAMLTTPARPSPSSWRDSPDHTDVVPGRRRPPPAT
jgi:hypothetical protein